MDVYKGKKVAVLIAANNEEYKINRVIDRIHQNPIAKISLGPLPLDG